MTTRILNKTWFDQLRGEYLKDFEDDSIAYPLTYILYSPYWGIDIAYEIKRRTNPAAFAASLKNFRRCNLTQEAPPSYEDKNVRIAKLDKPEGEPQLCTDSASDQDSDVEAGPEN